MDFLEDELYHHGILGQKWGVRRYQNADGSLTPAGKKRYNPYSFKETFSIKRDNENDTVIEKGTHFSRLQPVKKFNKQYANFMSYLPEDTAVYDVWFSKKLMNQRNKEKVYKLDVESKRSMSIPSDENAANTLRELCKNKTYKEQVSDCIDTIDPVVNRYFQKLAVKNAKTSLQKEASDWTDRDKANVYNAFNISLGMYSSRESESVKNDFYKALKDKGYSAIVDLNDTRYAAFHAKSPVIVFDMDAVKLKSVGNITADDVKGKFTNVDDFKQSRNLIFTVSNLPKELWNTAATTAESWVNKKTYDELTA